MAAGYLLDFYLEREQKATLNNALSEKPVSSSQQLWCFSSEQPSGEPVP